MRASTRTACQSTDHELSLTSHAALEADRERGIVVPLYELPGFIKGVALSDEGMALLHDPSAPKWSLRGKALPRKALAVLPQSKPNSSTGKLRRSA